MQLLASYANDLTAAGKVKAMTKNERGYAKLFSINRGCRVWVHHTLDDKLILDLMVTKNEALKNLDVVKSDIGKFSQFVEEAGHPMFQTHWQHSISKGDVREQYYFEVTNEKVETIIALIDKARLAFQSL
jgi:hypothetical protein